MATRLFLSRKQYYGSDDPPVVTPSAVWDSTSGYARYGLSRSPQAEDFTTRSSTVTPNASEYDVMVLQFHSEPMRAQTIGAVAFHGVLRAYQAVSAGGLMMQAGVRVVGPDGTVRGTLLSLHSETVLSSTFAGTYTNRMIPPPAVSGTLSSLAVLDGDRLVVEVGYRAIGSSGSSVTGYFDAGSNSATNLVDDETGTSQYSPWIEIAQDILFGSTARRDAGATPRVGLASATSGDDAVSYATQAVPAFEHLCQDLGATRNSPPSLAYGQDAWELPQPPSGGAVTVHYHKRAWKSAPLPAGYVEWDTTDPAGAYPGGGTLDPPLGVVLYTWTT